MDSECTECTMSTSGTASGNEFITGGFIDLNASAAIIQTDKIFPAPFEGMAESNDVSTKINDFIDDIYGSNPYPTLTLSDGHLSCPSGYKLTAVNICGRAVIIVIPESQIRSGDAAGEDGYCTCTDGDCTLSTSTGAPGDKIYRCVGSCNGTCSLIICSVVGGETVYSSTTYGY